MREVTGVTLHFEDDTTEKIDLPGRANWTTTFRIEELPPGSVPKTKEVEVKYLTVVIPLP